MVLTISRFFNQASIPFNSVKLSGMCEAIGQYNPGLETQYHELGKTVLKEQGCFIFV